jgi:uncharacterized protein YutE (UPF0331/DUF86 family)
VVDADVVLRKSQAIEHHGARLRARMPLEAQALRLDESFRNDVCFDVIQAVQACIDLAIHACAHEALGVPEGPASAFALLAHHQVIEVELAERLTLAAGLRNLIVHQYTDLDYARLVKAITAGLTDLDAFVRAIRDHASNL